MEIKHGQKMCCLVKNEQKINGKYRIKLLIKKYRNETFTLKGTLLSNEVKVHRQTEKDHQN